MGYNAYCQLFAGTELSNVVEKITESKSVDVIDEWNGKVKGTKTISRNFYRFNGEDYVEIYDIHTKLKEFGLEIFSSNAEEGYEGMYIGVGKMSSYNKRKIKKTLEEIKLDIEKAKEELLKFGYNGEIEIYSMLYESY